MFAPNYFAPTYFPVAYFPNVGATAVIEVAQPGTIRMRILEDKTGRLLECGDNRLLEGLTAVLNLTDTSVSPRLITREAKTVNVKRSLSGKSVSKNVNTKDVGNV